MDFWTVFFTLTIPFAGMVGGAAVSIPRLFEAVFRTLWRMSHLLMASAIGFMAGTVYQTDVLRDAMAGKGGLPIEVSAHSMSVIGRSFTVAFTYMAILVCAYNVHRFIHGPTAGSQPDRQQRDETAPEKPAGES